MNHNRTYRPVPAPRLRDANGSISQAPCRSAGYAATHPVQPLKGLPGTRATDVSYRALAPGGAGFCYRICTGTSESRLTANWSFTFSAKEKDTETGYSYFGSRYYNSDLSIWLSVDPMSDKYPSLSPYVYCNNNPLSLIDFYGEDFVDFMNRLLEEPPHPPTDQNNPQELPEVVITPKPSSNTSSKNENVALNTKSKATVLTLPFPFVLGNVIECITAAVSPVWSILSVFPVLFKGDTRTELPPVTMQMSQLGINNGKLSEEEYECLKEKKSNGTISKQELLKLKKHEKNTLERRSRLSKDKRKHRSKNKSKNKE